MRETKLVVVKYIYMAISVAWLLWIFLSIIDTNQHNLPTSETYRQFAAWNFFALYF